MLDLAIRSLCILGKSFSRGMWKEGGFQSSRGKSEVKRFFFKKASFSVISKEQKMEEQKLDEC